MCMMAGYNGTKRAAPILIEMLRKEEGINAGCFTGIATLHEGKIYYRKLAGNLDRLLAETDAMDLPGSIGIIHSRTPNGVPVDSWAHPFTCEQDGRVRTALMLNGMNGCCNELNLKQYPTVLKKIKEAGYPLKSEADIPKDRILKHPKDGNKVYQKTDCLAQLASMRILEEGGVTTDFRSVWLLVFWGRLTRGGMILTPLTGHHMMHLPACLNHLPISAESLS